ASKGAKSARSWCWRMAWPSRAGSRASTLTQPVPSGPAAWTKTRSPTVRRPGASAHRRRAGAWGWRSSWSRPELGRWASRSWHSCSTRTANRFTRRRMRTGVSSPKVWRTGPCWPWGLERARMRAPGWVEILSLLLLLALGAYAMEYETVAGDPAVGPLGRLAFEGVHHRHVQILDFAALIAEEVVVRGGIAVVAAVGAAEGELPGLAHFRQDLQIPIDGAE